MMVDATVVMVENIYRHLEEHREVSTHPLDAPRF